jgi:hypothetical protein
LNVRLDEEKKRKEKTAGMEKRKRTMVEVSTLRGSHFGLYVVTDNTCNLVLLTYRPYKLEKRKPNELNWTRLDDMLKRPPKPTFKNKVGR